MSYVVIIVYVKVLGLTGLDLQLALSKKLVTKYSWNSESTASPDSWLEWFLNTYILGFFQLRLNSKKKKLIGGFLSYKYSILGTSEGTACGVDHQYAGLEIVRATSTGITITSTPQCSRPWFCYLNSWELRDHFHGASVLSKIKHRWIISFPFIFWQDMGNRLAGPIYLATSISLSVCFQVAVPCTRPPEGKKNSILSIRGPGAGGQGWSSLMERYWVSIDIWPISTAVIAIFDISLSGELVVAQCGTRLPIPLLA